jgi:mycothiol synthase
VGKLLTRAYLTGDAVAVAGLMNTIEEHAGAHPGWTPGDVDRFVGTGARDLGSDTRLVFAPGGDLVAAALVIGPPAGGYRVDLAGGVDPMWRGRGLGRDLLRWQLARAGELHAREAPQATWEAHTGADVADEPALRLFRRLGLSPLRYWFEMVAPTARPPVLPLPAGLKLVGYSADLDEQLYGAHTEAFADHWGYQRRPFDHWVRLTVGCADFEPTLSVAAFDGDQLAGYVLSYRDAEPSRLYVGHVGVRRPWRRRGLAAAMLAAVLADAGRAGRASAGLGVDADSPTGAVGVYERVGFTVQTRGVTYGVPLGRVPARGDDRTKSATT